MNRIDKYRACAAQGMSINDVARLYEVTPHAIRLANRKHNLGFKVRPIQRSRDLTAMRERVEAMRTAGRSCRYISVSLGVPLSTMRWWVKRWGITTFLKRRPVLEMLGDHLGPSEVDDLRFLKRKRYLMRDALVAINRPDLLEYLP